MREQLIGLHSSRPGARIPVPLPQPAAPAAAGQASCDESDVTQAAAATPASSVGLSVVSLTPPRVPFTDWAAAGGGAQAEPTFASWPPNRSDSTSSPGISAASISLLSKTPPLRVPFADWAKEAGCGGSGGVSEGRSSFVHSGSEASFAPDPAAVMTAGPSISSADSAGLSVLSRPLPRVPYADWAHHEQCSWTVAVTTSSCDPGSAFLASPLACSSASSCGPHDVESGEKADSGDVVSGPSLVAFTPSESEAFISAVSDIGPTAGQEWRHITPTSSRLQEYGLVSPSVCTASASGPALPSLAAPSPTEANCSVASPSVVAASDSHLSLSLLSDAEQRKVPFSVWQREVGAAAGEATPSSQPHFEPKSHGDDIAAGALVSAAAEDCIVRDTVSGRASSADVDPAILAAAAPPAESPAAAFALRASTPCAVTIGVCEAVAATRREADAPQQVDAHVPVAAHHTALPDPRRPATTLLIREQGKVESLGDVEMRGCTPVPATTAARSHKEMGFSFHVPHPAQQPAAVTPAIPTGKPAAIAPTVPAVPAMSSLPKAAAAFVSVPTAPVTGSCERGPSCGSSPMDLGTRLPAFVRPPPHVEKAAATSLLHTANKGPAFTAAGRTAAPPPPPAVKPPVRPAAAASLHEAEPRPPAAPTSLSWGPTSGGAAPPLAPAMPSRATDAAAAAPPRQRVPSTEAAAPSWRQEAVGDAAQRVGVAQTPLSPMDWSPVPPGPSAAPNRPAFTASNSGGQGAAAGGPDGPSAAAVTVHTSRPDAVPVGSLPTAASQLPFEFRRPLPAAVDLLSFSPMVEDDCKPCSPPADLLIFTPVDERAASLHSTDEPLSPGPMSEVPCNVAATLEERTDGNNVLIDPPLSSDGECQQGPL